MDTAGKNLNRATEEGEMSVAQARETLWPILNQHPKTGQPMGKLMDAGILTDKDLGYLAENGHKPLDRQAAKILLLQRLNNLDTSEAVDFPRTIVPKTWTYSERKQHQYTLMQGAILGFILGLAITSEIYFISKASFNQLTNPNYIQQLLIPLIIVLIPASLIMILLNKIFNRAISSLDKQIENCRKGRIGEDLTANIVQQSLNKNWSVYLNLLLPEKKAADMDVALVGPQGIWMLEVKNIEGQFRNTGEQWEFLNGSQWKIAKQNPTKQVRRNAARLNSFLKAQGIDRTGVNTAIVWVNIEQKPKTENALAAVWSLDTLRDELMHISQQNKKYSFEEQKIITDKLDSLYKVREEPASTN